MFRKIGALLMDSVRAIEEGQRNALVLQPRHYRIEPHEETEWGVIFAIVSPNGEIVGTDRQIPARERCAALNAEIATRH